MSAQGNIFLGGEFTSIDGVARSRIGRIVGSTTGNQLDTSFAPNFPIDPSAHQINAFGIEATPQGTKIMIAGELQRDIEGGKAGPWMARTLADGSLDTTFDAIKLFVQGQDSEVLAMVLQPADQKIIIGGIFTQLLKDGAPQSHHAVARLTMDGVVDTSFGDPIADNQFPGQVYSLALQQNGMIVAGGNFKSPFTGVSNIMRLTITGTLDPNFARVQFAGHGDTVSAVVVQPADGKIIIGGDFMTINGTQRLRIARLNSDGTLDMDFGGSTWGANNTVNTIALQADGKIVIGGDFTQVSGQSCGGVVRLNSNGSLDMCFGLGSGAVSGLNHGYVYSLLNTGSYLLVGGMFDHFNGLPCQNFVRLNSDGSVDCSFSTATGANLKVNTFAPNSTGVFIGGSFTSINGVSRPDGVARLVNE